VDRQAIGLVGGGGGGYIAMHYLNLYLRQTADKLMKIYGDTRTCGLIKMYTLNTVPMDLRLLA